MTLTGVGVGREDSGMSALAEAVTPSTPGFVWTSDRSAAFSTVPGHGIRAYECASGVPVPSRRLELPVVHPECLEGTPCEVLLDITPDDTRLVAVDPVGGFFSLVDIESGTSLTIAAASHPVGVRVSPDGRLAWVREASGEVTVIDIHAAPRVVDRLAPSPA